MKGRETERNDSGAVFSSLTLGAGNTSEIESIILKEVEGAAGIAIDKIEGE